LAAGGLTAAGASAQPHPTKPTARSVFAKLHSGSAALNRHLDSVGEEDEGDDAESVQLRAEYEQSILAAPAESSPTAALLAAHRAAAQLPTVGGRWYGVTNRPFINDPIPRGANYGEGYGNITGRVTALTHSGSVVYLGSASGGVWRSFDQGAQWHPINRGLPRLAVGALATDPSDGSVWVGTGEANNASENQYGVGVYRLARGANRWHKVGGSELYGAGSYRIRWIRGYTYIATSRGLYRRAADAPRAKPWHPVLQPSGNVVYPPKSSVTDFLPKPGTHGRRIIAVVGWAGYSDPPAIRHNGFYVGTGARHSFHKVTPHGQIDPATIGRTSFSASHGWIYAVVQSTASGDLRQQGVYLSKTGAAAGPWRRIANVAKLHNSDSALSGPSGNYWPGVQADYNQYILADPHNRRHVYLGLEEVFESTDAGKNWLAVAPYWNFDISCNPTGNTPYSCPFTVHSDQHGNMIYDGQFWTGSDGGAWRRPLHWHQRGQWTDLNATLYVTQNYSIATGTVPTGRTYWGGLQDSGESYTRTHLYDVEQAFTGDGGDTIVAPHRGNHAVEEYVYLDMYLTTDGARNVLREISPSCLTASNPPKVCDPDPRFIAPIAMDVNNPNHWVAGGQYVWNDTKSWKTVCDGNSGCDWKKVYDTGDGHQVTALADNGATTYAAWCGSCNPPDFTRGMATNYGGSWHKVSLHGVPNRYITSIAVDPHNAAHAYISVGSYSRRWIPTAGYGHVFETTNAGKTWRNVTGNLPDAPVFTVALAGSRLVVGTEVGAFVARRPNGKPAAWSRLGHGLPNVTVWDLAVTSNNLVVAGTHGRGDWQIKLR
jgi:hypothetical protein